MVYRWEYAINIITFIITRATLLLFPLHQFTHCIGNFKAHRYFGNTVRTS